VLDLRRWRLPRLYGSGMSAAEGMRHDLLELFRSHAFTDQGSSPHGWRCEYPDRYGPCTCPGELADDVITWMADRLREAQAQALERAAVDLALVVPIQTIEGAENAPVIWPGALIERAGHIRAT
jgi:hypothetical protein